MSMKTTFSSNPGPDLSKLPSGVQPPRRPISEPHPAAAAVHSDAAATATALAAVLSELVDRSLCQITILRGAMDEAAMLESSARAAAAELTARRDTLADATAGLDSRLARTDAAAETFQRAAQAVDGLNAIAAQIRAAAAAIDQRINAQLADHQRRLDALLADHKLRIDRAIADQQAHMAGRIAEFDASFAAQLRELGEVHTRATAAAHNACERAVQSTRAAGANATESARQTIASVEENIAAQVGTLAAKLREGAAEAASESVLQIAQARESDDALRARLEQAARLVETLDRRLEEILSQSKTPPLRRAA